MKYLALVLFFAVMLPLYSQWQPNGNNMKLNAGIDKIRDFAISEDSKFIYTLADTGIISKWDAETGENIFRKKIISDSTRPLTANWLFLSSDGKTYCTTYPISNYEGTYIVFIYSIDNETFIDSINIQIPFYLGYSNIDINQLYLDYCYKKEIIVSAYSLNSMLIGYGSGLKSGGLTVQKKQKTGYWKSLLFLEGSPLNVNISNDFSYIFENHYYEYDMIYPPDHSHSHDVKQYGLFYDFDSTKAISSYYYSSTDGSSSSSGSQVTFSSSFFKEDNKKACLIAGNQIFAYELKPVNLINTYKINGLSATNSLKINYSTDSNYFFIYYNNRIDIISYSDTIISISCLLNNCGNITKLISLPNKQQVIISENSGKILKVNDSDLFKLSANFTTNSPVYSQFDTISFKNLSIGYPASYKWDFGDGTSSTVPNPSHIYSKEGYYNVTLTITKDNEMSTKTMRINIIKKLKANFEYTISGTNPIRINYNNKSIGNIDSVLWNLGDTTSKELNPVHDYFKPGNYTIILKVYSGGIASEISKIIYINVQIPQLDSDYFVYELIDSLHQGGMALKGYEQNNRSIVYHIKNDNGRFYYGTFYGNTIIWDSTSNSPTELMIQRNQNLFTIAHDSTIYNFNGMGKLSNLKFNKELLGSKTVRNNINDIIFTVNDNCHISYTEFDRQNNLINNSLLYSLHLCSLPCLRVNWNIAIVLKNNKVLDYSNFAEFSACYQDHHNQGYNTSYLLMNNYFMSVSGLGDLIRFNDSTLIVTGYEFIDFYRSYGISTDTSKKLSSICTKVDSIQLSKFICTSLLKLNDTTFVVAGSNSNSPAFAIINNIGTILDSITIQPRTGAFDYISVTPDGNLLLSGYVNYYFGYKSPYFVKYNYRHTPIDTSSEGNNTNDTTQGNDTTKIQLPSNSVYPNPTTGSVTITFSLDNQSDTKLEIFDQYGNLMLEQIKECEKGDNSYNVDLTQYSAGMFYYRLQAGESSKYGSIVFIR